MIYFTADTHFGHDRTRILHKRPFDNVEEMNATLIHNWNKVIKETDTVYHLGDFGVPDPNILRQLNGAMYFLPSQDYDEREVVDFLSGRAVIIQPNTVIIEEGQALQLVHEPLTATAGGGFYLFGHIHRFQMVKRNGLCVSSDAHFFTPISLETVLFYKNAIENFYDENVFVERLGGNQP
jgi:calcineurin-like phosphoesterase family protein